MGVTIDPGLPGLFHKWGDVRMRRKNRRLREDNRDLRRELKSTWASLRACKKSRARLERDLKKSGG